METPEFSRPEVRPAGRCSIRDAERIAWAEDLPKPWRSFAVVPLRFEIFREYEMSAERALGYDECDLPCYCAYRYVLTELKSDENDVFYEAPSYAESVKSWRLRDDRWLVLRNVIANFELGAVHSFFSISETMPR